MRKVIRGADEATEKKLRTAFGHGEKPVIKVEGCKTDSPKKKAIRKPYQRKRLTMREQTALWRKSLDKAGLIPDAPIAESYDWWSLPVPDYDNPTAMLYLPDAKKPFLRTYPPVEIR